MKRWVMVLIIICTLASLNLQVLAADKYENSDSYIIFEDRRVPIPVTYTHGKVIQNLGENIGPMNNPQDLFIDKNGLMYVADTGNNRVLKMDASGVVLGVFTGPKEKPMNNPNGVYVDKDGDIYVADTGNKRILHLSPSGEWVEEFVKPQTELLEGFNFEPMKVYIDSIGQIYILNRSNFQGFMLIDANNEFIGNLGSTMVGFNLIDYLWRVLGTKEQRAKIAKRVAPPYSNFVIDDEGIVYATTVTTDVKQIVKLNSVGENVYNAYKNEVSYGEIIIKESVTSAGIVQQYAKMPFLTDIAVDNNGIITVLDREASRIYQYDQDGNMLAAFGGSGSWKGRFEIPTSLAVDKEGNIAVLDSKQNNIQIMKPTRFIKLVHEASKLYYDGEYDKSRAVWEEVLKIGSSYQIANRAIAKTLMKEEKWKEAMEHFYAGEDKEGYSSAFAEYRYETIRDNFVLIFLSSIFLIIILVWLFWKLKDTADKENDSMNQGAGPMRSIKQILLIIFHPIDSFPNIKSYRDKFSYIPAITIFLLIMIVRVLEIYVVHFPLASIEPRNANIVLEFVKIMLPILTWVLSSYAITSILGGEVYFNEVLTSASYAMLPYIVCMIPLILVSRILCLQEAGLYRSLQIGMWAWILLLFFISVQSMNEYSIKQTVGIIFLSLVGVILIWVLALIFYTLTSQLFRFISELTAEIRAFYID